MIIVDDISNVDCFINTVLIRPLRSEDEVLLAGDKKLYIDTSYEKLKHVPVVGIVAAVPEQLYFTTKKDRNSTMEWETEMELKVGDIVNYHFLDMFTVIEQDDYVVCHGKIYYPIRYDRIFCAKRRLVKRGDLIIPEYSNFVLDEHGYSEVIMLNGYILASPVEQVIETSLKLPQSLQGKHNAKFGIVKFFGSCNKRYNTPYPPDDTRLGFNDLIVLDSVCDIKLEYDLHAQFDKTAKYFRIERRNIKAIIKPNPKKYE